MSFTRKKFLQTTFALSAFPLAGYNLQGIPPWGKSPNNRFKVSLNTYSFNAPLRSGKIVLSDVIDFCAAHGFEAVDLTGYYFPGYPAVPPDEYIYQLKRKAHLLGIAISGTGIRTDFVDADKAVRTKDVDLTKKWIEVAAKLGAPVIRIFSGKPAPANVSRDTATGWILDDIKTCVEYGKQHGVIVAVQNHNDFIKTADETIDLIKKVNSEWFGLILDTGSFTTHEPYSEIAKVIPYAVNWQIKEKINYDGKNADVDLLKLFSIINASTYRGYLPIETLNPGDPFVIIPPFLKQVRDAMDKS
jgi:sugar phosphate isomerase/epimerase